MQAKVFPFALAFFAGALALFFLIKVFFKPSPPLIPVSGKTIIEDKKVAMHVEYVFDPTSTPTPTFTPTPTPKPTPIPTPSPTPFPLVTSQELENLFSQYSLQFSVDKEQLKRIAHCESKFNSEARNGPYGGMFQFLDTSWIVTRQSMGHDTNPDLRFNTEEAIKTAAFKIARGGLSAWKNCSK